jgi:TRAP-type C4-dicarboxylate transport system permease large subunit
MFRSEAFSLGTVTASGSIGLLFLPSLPIILYGVKAQTPINEMFYACFPPWVFLLVLNGFLLVVGCLMDIFSAIFVVVPLILSVADRFGIDPLHLGAIFLINLERGYLTPPVGMNLFLSSYRFNKPMPQIIRAVLPFMLVQLAAVLLVTVFPSLSAGFARWWARP